LGFPGGYSLPSLILFLGEKIPQNMRWTNEKRGNMGKRILKIRNGFARRSLKLYFQM